MRRPSIEMLRTKFDTQNVVPGVYPPEWDWDNMPDYSPEEIEENRRKHRQAIKDAREESARRSARPLNPKVAAQREEGVRQAKLGVDRAHEGCDAGKPR